MALTIVTNPVTAIATTTATCGGNSITGTITGSITAKGVCWSTTVNPVASGSHIAANLTTYPSNTNFPSAITSLTTGTTYYVRAYVTDGSGTYYGANVVFTTLGLTTAAASSITSTTATSGATSISGFTSISAVGVCWSTTTTPTTSNNHTNDVLVGNAFTSYLTGLIPGVLYYVRAYIISGGTTYYATQITFTTTSTTPSVNYTSISGTTSSSTQITGVIVNNNGSSIISRGVRYSTSPIFLSYTDQSSIGATSPFTCILSGLSSATTYYFKVYAENSDGTTYTTVYNFTTLGGPTVETIIPYSITSSTAQVGCNILSIGGSPLTARGVVISTTSGVTIATGTVYTDLYPGNGSQYLTKLTGLTKDTTYYIKAYATNAQGTGYGEELIFSTTSCNPLVEECNPQEYPVVECSDPACEYIIPLECVIGETTPPQCTNLTPEDPTLLSSLIKINEVLCSLSTRDFAIYILGTIINNPNMNTIFCNVDDSSCRT